MKRNLNAIRRHLRYGEPLDDYHCDLVKQAPNEQLQILTDATDDEFEHLSHEHQGMWLCLVTSGVDKTKVSEALAAYEAQK